MKKNTSYTIGAVIVLLICAFCFVAVPAFTGADSTRTIPAFGKYNGHEIKYDQNSDFYNIVAQDMQIYEYNKVKVTADLQKSVFESAYKTLVLKYAYDDFVKASGYVVPSYTLTRELINNYYSEGGEYSSALYKQVSDEDKRSIQKATEESLYSGRLYDDLFGSEEVVGKHSVFGLKESDAELDFLRDYNSEKRGFDMAVFNLSDFPVEEKVKFAKENSEKFIGYDVSIITVDDKSTAQTVAKRIANNEITFEDAIAEYSNKLLTNTEGKFNGNYQYQLESILYNKEDISKISELEVGANTDAIQTFLGYSLFKLNSSKTQPDFNSDSILFDINSYINNYEKNLIEDYFIAKGNDFAANAAGKDFEAACTAAGAEYVQIEPFPLNYGSIDIAESVYTGLTGLQYADTDESFLKTAFSLSKDEFSSPILLSGNCVAVLKYTTDGSDSVNTTSPFALSSLEKYDQSDVNNSIFKDTKKFVDNFSDVYKKYFGSSNQ